MHWKTWTPSARSWRENSASKLNCSASWLQQVPLSLSFSLSLVLSILPFDSLPSSAAAGDEKASGIVEALRLLLTIELHAKIEIFNDLTEWIEKAQMLRADGNESPLLLRLRQMETRFAPPSTSTSTSTTIGKKRELSSSDTDEKKNKIASKRRILSHLKDSMEILMKDIITVQEEVDELEH